MREATPEAGLEGAAATGPPDTGISTAALIRTKAYQPDDDELARIWAFAEACDVAWMTVETGLDALKCWESRVKIEWTPPLMRM